MVFEFPTCIELYPQGLWMKLPSRLQCLVIIRPFLWSKVTLKFSSLALLSRSKSLVSLLFQITQMCWNPEKRKRKWMTLLHLFCSNPFPPSFAELSRTKWKNSIQARSQFVELRDSHESFLWQISMPATLPTLSQFYRRIVCSSESSCNIFWSSKVAKGSVGERMRKKIG